ncbi:MAG: YdbL family protein [Bdellovibrionales bacterium]|nr:YdbL family protein [Bdellovibrionales bacterium]
MFQKTTAILTLAILTSCVTVNVNFPEGAVQKAADDYVRELYKSKQKTTPEGKPSTFFFDFSLVATAVAADFKISSEESKKIMEKQKERLGDVDGYKAKGVIGETSEGLIEVYKDDKLSAIEKKKVQRLVSEENNDREALYSDIVKSNGMTDAMKAGVRKTFFQSLRDASPAGTPVKEGGAWIQNK